jgi:hypothetical protein
MPVFTLPKGVEVPENLQEGEKFQTMATLTLKKNGKAELCEVDGQPLAGYEAKESEKESEGTMKGHGMEEKGEMVHSKGGSGGFIAEVMQRGRGPMA